MLTLALGGCFGSDNKPQLSVAETPPPDLLGAKDIDDAMRERIARAVERPAAGAESESHYRQLAQERPNAAEPRVALGRILQQKQDLDGAKAAFREAAGLEPHNVDAWVGLAQVELARKRPAEAIATLDKALAAAPGELRLLNAKGVILDRGGQHREAQALYRQALLGQPKNQMVRHNLGRSLALDGHAQEAIAILRPLAREPNAPPAARESLALAMERQRASGT
ncbi:tetratricopeptide repeat protein (plasmid) [Bosea vestrisii]|uniref:tetratricopeptide repeat protein n=1 Tax=Bosea vestrisii TaxID=151416 RepID=UPI0024E01733|nr:tetratricopeptide repeat protein [Bosea vestrisii]WID99717.1 tetratricopeptide repeat protein [Bosea vestrisii]